ncbi:hypothetical protein OROHE_020003 [Orobanche hederae]
MTLHYLKKLKPIAYSICQAETFHQYPICIIITIPHHFLPIEFPSDIDIFLDENIKNCVQQFQRRGSSIPKLGHQIEHSDHFPRHSSPPETTDDSDENVIIWRRTNSLRHFIEQLLYDLKLSKSAELVDQSTVGGWSVGEIRYLRGPFEGLDGLVY